MPIAGELVRISTATISTLPLDLASLSAHPPWLPFPPTQFHRQFFFAKLRKPRLDCSKGCLLHLLLYSLDDRPAVFSLQFPHHKLYTHRADCLLVIDVIDINYSTTWKLFSFLFSPSFLLFSQPLAMDTLP